MKEYSKPTAEIIYFDVDDVIAVSLNIEEPNPDLDLGYLGSSSVLV